MGPPAAPTVLTEIAKGSSSNVHLPMNALSPLPSPQLISQLHISGDHTLHDIKHLEQLLDSSLVAVAAIQSSGSTLEDVLTPRAYNTFKALYALAPLVTASSSTKPNRSEIPTRSTFSDMGNDYPNSSNGSPLLPNSSLGVPRTGRIHISITVEYVMFFSWAGLAVVACLVLVCLGYAKESPWSKRSFWRQGIYIYWLYIYLVLTCIINQRFVVSFLLVWPPVCHISNVSTPSPASEDFFLVCFIYWLLVLFP